MNSIATRLLLSASLILAGFVLLTSLSVRHSVHTRAEQALYDRLQGLIYGILGASELDANGLLRVNSYELPNQQLTSPVSGTYAEVIAADGQKLWSSASTTAMVPAIRNLSVGDWHFSHYSASNASSGDTIATEDAEVRSLQFATSWASEEGAENTFFLQVVNDASEFNSQLRNFDRTLWISLLLSALILLLIQLLVLSWGLNPLAKISRGLKQIENGEAEILDTRLPIELKPLANSVNTLLQSERNRHLRYRNVVDDLAHSLKTPLTVIRNIASQNYQQSHQPSNQQDAPQDNQSQHAILEEQSNRMQDIIAYHLQRAAASGVQALSPPISPLPILKRLAASLTKVYPDTKVQFTFNLKKKFQVRVNEADLLEILGNTLENSCKYGASSVEVSKEVIGKHQIMHIDDDGPGFPSEHIKLLSQRGMRADTRRDGQGLGLAVSRELLESYGGGLRLSNRKLGGARCGARVSMLFTMA